MCGVADCTVSDQAKHGGDNGESGSIPHAPSNSIKTKTKPTMQQVTIFNSPQFGEIRVSGTPDNPMFCLADVCKVLELQVTPTKNRLRQDGVNSIKVIDNLGREQQAIFINEQNLYKVIMRSDKPQAEPFQDWVCGEVLPSIRKNGTYMTPSTIEQALTSPDFLIKLANQLKQEREKRAEVEEIAKKRQATIDSQREVIREQASKVLFADTVSASNKSILVSELAKLIRQNGYDTGQNRLFKWLRRNGYLCSKGEQFNIPTQRAMENGYFEIKKTTITKPDGSVLVSSTPKVTPKGQMHIISKFMGEHREESKIAI